jgi:hypothetical protein
MYHRTSLILLLSVILASSSAEKRGLEAAPSAFGLPRKWSSFTGMAGLDHEVHEESEISNEKITEVKMTGNPRKKVVQEEPGKSPLLPHPADRLNNDAMLVAALTFLTCVSLLL